jgi:site-specific DNA-cytosine methylase
VDDLTHASFFSGVGGLDLGLERAGWRTVSFSEIDPYASAVLAQRWPGVPNLGSIVDVADRWGLRQSAGGAGDVGSGSALVAEVSRSVGQRVDWHGATLWTGGFPCQDLSVAGKRRGMGEGTRSGLAYAFLDLAAVHRPRFVLLENVPGLLSSHGGRDMAALLGALVELGYGVGYRILDARYFGVPQRRRRVFILGDSLGGRAGAERASEVLSVGSRCRRHPPAGVEAGPGVADRATPGVDIARTVVGTSWKRHDEDIDTLIPSPADDARGQGRGRQGSAALGGHEPDPRHGTDPDAVREDERSSSDAHGMRKVDGLARWLDDRGGVADTHSVAFMENQRGELRTSDQTDSLKGGGGKPGQGYQAVFGASGMSDDPMLPLGLDSHRYRCCGNGVVSDVAEWIGRRLAAIA